MEIYLFPVGVVALDFDAPTQYFWDGEDGAYTMNDGVRAVCVTLSQKWQLGRFWLYRTKSGLHAVFECVLQSAADALEVLLDANTCDGWRECGGHMIQCAGGTVALRVGRKNNVRPFDIRPLDEVDDSAPKHVREHHRLITGGHNA